MSIVPLKKLIVICGPTAVGKTSYAVSLAKKIKGEIVSADSRQVYKEMDIATAKPTKAEQEGIRHHMLDIIFPQESFSVACYQHQALLAIHDVIQRGKQPILVGGTGLYISAIIEGYHVPQVMRDEKLRQQLAKKNTNVLYALLKKMDPEYAEIVDKNNKVRLIRAIEVGQKTGKKFSQLRTKKHIDFDINIIRLQLPRAELYRRIEERIGTMLEKGLLEEVAYLGKKYGWKIPSMLTLGYKQLGYYIRGEVSFDRAIELFKRDTRRYAKRQLTWFRNKNFLQEQ